MISSEQKDTILIVVAELQPTVESEKRKVNSSKEDNSLE